MARTARWGESRPYGPDANPRIKPQNVNGDHRFGLIESSPGFRKGTAGAVTVEVMEAYGVRFLRWSI